MIKCTKEDLLVVLILILVLLIIYEVRVHEDININHAKTCNKTYSLNLTFTVAYFVSAQQNANKFLFSKCVSNS